MLNTRKILYWAVTAVCCGLLPFGCVKEDAASLGERHDLAVRLNVGTRAVSETDGTPTDAESAIHTLRVYAFVGGQPAGHYFTDDVEKLPHTFFMDLTFYSTTTQRVDFYVVANEGAMLVQGSGVPESLSETTSENQLKAYWFTELRDVTTYGLPMFCEQQATLDFTNVSDEIPTDPEHTGHTLLDYDITFELQRPVGKLGVFAAKPQGETGELRITGLTMLSSGTLTRNYLMPQTDETLKDITSIVGDFELEVVGEAVTKELANGISEDERKNPANYTAVLNVPFYPFENPWGSSAWNAKGDEKGNVLQIDYSFGEGNARTGLVYLPPIVRNRYYTVCCLMHNDGKITVEYRVADWEGVTYPLEFDYPSYENPITPANGTSLPGGGKYPQPTVWFNSDPDSPLGSYSFSFKMTGPTGQKWTPTLLNNPGKFKVSVYQNGTEITDADKWVASPDAYEIRVRAVSAENVGDTVSLGISYKPTWSEASSLLLINGLTNDLKWEESTLAETIVIKQIEIPQN